MSLFAIEHLLIALSCISLAIFIAKYAETKAHRLWAIFNCVVASWSAWAMAVSLAPSPQQSLIYWKYALCSGGFISVVFYHFVTAYCQIERKMMIRFAYIEATLFIFTMLLTDKLVSAVTLTPYKIYYFKTTPLFSYWFSIW